MPPPPVKKPLHVNGNLSRVIVSAKDIVDVVMAAVAAVGPHQVQYALIGGAACLLLDGTHTNPPDITVDFLVACGHGTAISAYILRSPTFYEDPTSRVIRHKPTNVEVRVLTSPVLLSGPNDHRWQTIAVLLPKSISVTVLRPDLLLNVMCGLMTLPSSETAKANYGRQIKDTILSLRGRTLTSVQVPFATPDLVKSCVERKWVSMDFSKRLGYVEGRGFPVQ